MMPTEEYIALVPSNHAIINFGKESLKKNLKQEFEDHCFKSNKGWFLGGLLLSIGFISYGAFAIFEEGQNSTGLILFGGVVTAMVSSVLYGGYRKLLTISGRHVISRNHSLLARTVPPVLVVGLIILIVNSWAPDLLRELYAGLIVGFLLISGALATVCYLFHELLKQPTLQGRKTADEIDGFRMYLETAEADRLEELYPPRKDARIV